MTEPRSRRQPDRPVRIDVDRVVVDPGTSHSLAELRAALARALGPALVGRLGAGGIERAAATLERGIAGRVGPAGRSRDLEVRDGD